MIPYLSNAKVLQEPGNYWAFWGKLGKRNYNNQDFVVKRRFLGIGDCRLKSSHMHRDLYKITKYDGQEDI